MPKQAPLNLREKLKFIGPGILDVTVWRERRSMTVHLVNLTNPTMMKGPFREFIPIGAQEVQARIPRDTEVRKIHLLVSNKGPDYTTNRDVISLTVPSILDHEVVALDLAT